MTVWYRAFTLIELLVVILVILILITLSVPVFQKVLFRARVVKAAEEVRLIVTALDLYYQDWLVYPLDHHGDWPYQHPEEFGFVMLTTPLQYLTRLLPDPFGTHRTIDPNVQGITSSYYGGSGSDNPACGGRAHYANPLLRKNDPSCVDAYLVFSIGPDGGRSSFGGPQFPLGDPAFPYPVTIVSYSPLNGVRSEGDIFKMTGNWTAGSVMVDYRMITSQR